MNNCGRITRFTFLLTTTDESGQGNPMQAIYRQKWVIHSQMSTFSTQFISDNINGFKFISNYVYRMKYFATRLLSILQTVQMIISMHKIISKTSDKSVFD